MKLRLSLLALIGLLAVASIFQTQRKPDIQARFEVAEIAQGDTVPFRIHLNNHSDFEVSGLQITASAGLAFTELSAPILEAGEERIVEGTLNLSSDQEAVEFSARVIGPGVSYRSPSIKVVRPAGRGGGEALLYSQIPQAQQVQQLRQEPVLLPNQLGEDPGIAVPAEPQLAFGNLEQTESEEDVQQLISQVQTQDCAASKKTLEIYQKMGNSEADRFLVSSR